MSSTVDANVLLYASDETSTRHGAARSFLDSWTAGPDLVYLFWPVAMAYIRIATHPGIFARPLTPAAAQANVEALLARRHVRTGAEDDEFWITWRSSTEGVVVRGNDVPDAHLVALMRQHGVTDIWTKDADFRRYPGIRVRDPFEDGDSAARGR